MCVTTPGAWARILAWLTPATCLCLRPPCPNKEIGGCNNLLSLLNQNMAAPDVEIEKLARCLLFCSTSEVETNMHSNEDSIVHECALRWCRDTLNLCKHNQLVQLISSSVLAVCNPTRGTWSPAVLDYVLHMDACPSTERLMWKLTSRREWKEERSCPDMAWNNENSQTKFLPKPGEIKVKTSFFAEESIQGRSWFFFSCKKHSPL